MILQCPYCLDVREWSREKSPEGPGSCDCGKQRVPYRVLTKRPEPIGRGSVQVIDYRGRRELVGPDFVDPLDRDEPPSIHVKLRNVLRG